MVDKTESTPEINILSHKFNCNFHCPDPSCLCKTVIDDNEHFLLHCPCFSSQCKGLLDLVSSLTGTEVMHLYSKSSVDYCSMVTVISVLL